MNYERHFRANGGIIGHAITTKSGGEKEKQSYVAAEDISSPYALKRHLCEGFKSQCRGCENIDKCKFGQRWIEMGCPAPKMNRYGKEYANRQKYAHKRYENRKQNGLCTDCGEKLPDGYERAICPECLKKRRDARAERKGKKNGRP